MARQFDTLDGMLHFLSEKGAGEVTLSAKVATTTSPGGDQIAFRGRIVVEARYGARGRAQYIEQVMPYIASTKAPPLDATPERAADLRSAQLSLARQLRTYRGEYQAVVASVRAELAARIQESGLVVVESED